MSEELIKDHNFIFSNLDKTYYEFLSIQEEYFKDPENKIINFNTFLKSVYDDSFLEKLYIIDRAIDSLFDYLKRDPELKYKIDYTYKKLKNSFSLVYHNSVKDLTFYFNNIFNTMAKLDFIKTNYL